MGRFRVRRLQHLCAHPPDGRGGQGQARPCRTAQPMNGGNAWETEDFGPVCFSACSSGVGNHTR